MIERIAPSIGVDGPFLPLGPIRLSPVTGIRCELTATARVGVHRYRFPDAGPGHVLIDVPG